MKTTIIINIPLEDANISDFTEDINKVMRRLKHKYNCSYTYKLENAGEVIKNTRSRDYDSTIA